MGWKIEGECNRCGACCRVKHPDMVDGSGEQCRFLDEAEGSPPTCPIRLEWEEGVAIPERPPVQYWKTQCRDFPSLEADGAPLSDTDCRHLQQHLVELGCSYTVVETED